MQAHVGTLVDHEAREDGQRRAHQRRRNQHKQERKPETEGGQDGEILPPVAVGPGVDQADARQQEGGGRAADADSDLQQRVKPQRAAQAVADPPERPASERQPRHERRQHGADGIQAGAEGVQQHPGPDDLIHQARGAGGQEKRVSEQARQIGAGSVGVD